MEGKVPLSFRYLAWHKTEEDCVNSLLIWSSQGKASCSTGMSHSCGYFALFSSLQGAPQCHPPCRQSMF